MSRPLLRGSAIWAAVLGAAMVWLTVTCEYRPPRRLRASASATDHGVAGSGNTGAGTSTGTSSGIGGVAGTGGVAGAGGLVGGFGGFGGGSGGCIATGGAGGQGEVVPDFHLVDVNETSPSYGTLVSPRDYLQQISAWYFGTAT